MTEDYGYVKAAAAVTGVRIGDPVWNTEAILSAVRATDARIVVFPELSVTGYTCGDLFLSGELIGAAERALAALAEASAAEKGRLIAVGAPLRADNAMYNCAVFIANGRILGAVPKTFIPNYGEFYEARWFSSADCLTAKETRVGGEMVPIGTDLLFCGTKSRLCVAAELCEDLWMSATPGARHARAGANVIVNLSASNDTVTKAEYRRQITATQSAKCISGYVYASAGPDESTSDTVFSGHAMIYDNGRLLAESRYDERVTEGLIDLERIENERIRMRTYMHGFRQEYRKIAFDDGEPAGLLPDSIEPYPFIPGDETEKQERCREILKLQALGLSQRMKKSGTNRLVIGISGGLDSTLALLAASGAVQLRNVSPKNIICITMPGFGTTTMTHGNADALMKAMGINARTIPIGDACIQHLAAIGHDGETADVTYENAQARERTQILMDVANQEGALVVGTGDLSELALGWCTYNGDHMSMYAVNAGIPKTLVRYVIAAYAESHPKVKNILDAVLETPISPELIPPDKSGKIVQKTESVIGKYDLHDFTLYYTLRYGFGPKKIFALAKKAFQSVEEGEILETMKTFYRRFFTQQFKRNCLPDGVKVGSVCLSPRADWRMPSDASMALWMEFFAR